MTTTGGRAKKRPKKSVLASEGPELYTRVFHRGFGTPVANGRTKDAYELQLRPLKWKCHRCIQVAKRTLAEENKTLSQNDAYVFSFESKEALESHKRVKHHGVLR